MYLHPEYPTYQEQIDAHDHMVLPLRSKQVPPHLESMTVCIYQEKSLIRYDKNALRWIPRVFGK